MARRTTCPVPFTCPDINSVIHEIKSTVEDLQLLESDFMSMTPNDIMKMLSEAADRLNDLISGNKSALEEIREANHNLREWGADLEEASWKLEDTISNNGDEIEDLKDQVGSLKDEIDSLENQIEELRKNTY